MIKDIDEFEMSFPINVWNEVLYNDIAKIKLDIFYNSHGHPKYVHGAFGTSAIKEFRTVVINEILERNAVEKAWIVSSDAFAIMSKDSNCDSFKVDFRGIEHTILKKTIVINAYE